MTIRRTKHRELDETLSTHVVEVKKKKKMTKYMLVQMGDKKDRLVEKITCIFLLIATKGAR